MKLLASFKRLLLAPALLADASGITSSELVPVSAYIGREIIEPMPSEPQLTLHFVSQQHRLGKPTFASMMGAGNGEINQAMLASIALNGHVMIAQDFNRVLSSQYGVISEVFRLQAEQPIPVVYENYQGDHADNAPKKLVDEYRRFFPGGFKHPLKQWTDPQKMWLYAEAASHLMLVDPINPVDTIHADFHGVGLSPQEYRRRIFEWYATQGYSQSLAMHRMREWIAINSALSVAKQTGSKEIIIVYGAAHNISEVVDKCFPNIQLLEHSTIHSANNEIAIQARAKRQKSPFTCHEVEYMAKTIALYRPGGVIEIWCDKILFIGLLFSLVRNVFEMMSMAKKENLMLMQCVTIITVFSFHKMGGDSFPYAQGILLLMGHMVMATAQSCCQSYSWKKNIRNQARCWKMTACKGEFSAAYSGPQIALSL